MQKTCASTHDPAFLGTLASWLENRPDMLVLFRCSDSAGTNGFEIFTSYSKLEERIRELPPLTTVIAFKQPQLPLRGVVDDKFIEKSVKLIPDDTEYLAVETVRQVHGGRSWFHDYAGISQSELRDDLEESRGIPVAVGRYPTWRDGSDDVLIALSPQEDESEGGGVFDLNIKPNWQQAAA